MDTKARVPSREFNTLEPAGNWIPEGIWSDGVTMWVADWEDEKIYAYRMPQVDREALAAIYNATGGANWTNKANWLTSVPLGQWHGVTTGANGRVTKLELQENGLSGEVSAELGNLTSLAQLRLDGNQLAGEIPAELGSLANLTLLYLSGNQLTGCVPYSLRDVADNDFAQLGLPFCTSHDTNSDGQIDINEVIVAVEKYQAGDIDINELIEVIELYQASQS